MGQSRCRCDVLGALAGVALVTACSGVDSVGPPPEWIPIDQLNGVGRPEVVQVAGASIASQPTIRIATYNTLAGVHAKSSAALMSSPELMKADVIALQENLREFGDELSDAGKLAALLGMSYVFVPMQLQKDDDLEGVALLSRFPLQDIQVMPLQDFTDNDYLDSAASRVSLSATIETTHGPIRICNTHLQVVLNMPERVLQVRPVVLDPSMPKIVLGDFNTNDYIWAGDRVPLLPPAAVANTSQANGLDDYMRGLGYHTPTAHFGDTWHGYPHNQRLDSIYTFELATGRGRVERGVGFSDHWPMWLDVSLP